MNILKLLFLVLLLYILFNIVTNNKYNIYYIIKNIFNPQPMEQWMYPKYKGGFLGSIT